MSPNAHPEVYSDVHSEVQEHDLASYGGWEDTSSTVAVPQQAVQTQTTGTMPLLDEEEHVSPDLIQQEQTWWMKPGPRMIVAGGAVMALLYVLFQMFGLWGSSEAPQASLMATDAAAIDQEVEARLRQLQEENENLKREQILGEPLPESNPKPVKQATPPKPQVTRTAPPQRSYPTQPVRATARPSAPRVVYRSVAEPPPQRVAAPAPPAAPARAAKPQSKPEPEPMEQWLAAANLGHYTAAKGDTYAAQAATYTPAASPEIYAAAPSGVEQNSGLPESELPTAVPLGPEANAPFAQGPGDGSFPLQSGSEVAPDPMAEEGSPFGPAEMAYSGQYLDIGSSAEAVLQNGVAWTQNSPQMNRKIVLRLSEGFKNSSGQQILPKGTRLIAQVTEASGSGLFAMDITHILQGREKTPVPPGALQVMAEDGTPLKANLKRKGGRSFWANFGSILAPGVEDAMDAVAGSADSLILEDGDRSLIQTSGGSRNPLAAGVSGMASGAATVFSDRLQDAPEDRPVPYFQFDSGKSVRVFVNDDLFL